MKNHVQELEANILEAMEKVVAVMEKMQLLGLQHHKTFTNCNRRLYKLTRNLNKVTKLEVI